MKIKLKFDVIPIPNQSVKVSVVNGRIKTYKPAKIKRYQDAISTYAIKQVRAINGFEMICGGVVINSLTYVLPVRKNSPKKVKEYIKSGGIVFSTTKPDLQDNLNKPFFDALEKIVFSCDSRVCLIQNLSKIYGVNPGIEIELEPLDEYLERMENEN